MTKILTSRTENVGSTNQQWHHVGYVQVFQNKKAIGSIIVLTPFILVTYRWRHVFFTNLSCYNTLRLKTLIHARLRSV